MSADLGIRRIGVFGGTFDPPHLAHLVVASDMSHRRQLSEIVFVPAGDPWQKNAVASVDQRFEMLALAVSGDDRFRVSRVDIDRGGPTYMVDTLSDLQRENPEAELVCIVGSDVVAGMSTWHDAELLPTLATFVAAARPGHMQNQPSIQGLTVESEVVPLLEISSTDVRHRVEQGLPIRYMVPDAVVEYIANHKLYGSTT